MPSPDIYFSGNRLEWVNNVKYLGTVIDSKLTYDLQIERVENRISRGKGVIYRLSSCSTNVLLKLYNSLLYSKCFDMGGKSSNKLNGIQVIMNKSLRLILNVKFNENFEPSISTNNMYKKLNLLKFKDIYHYFCLKFIH